jgi:hypothetical protein
VGTAPARESASRIDLTSLGAALDVKVTDLSLLIIGLTSLGEEII